MTIDSDHLGFRFAPPQAINHRTFGAPELCSVVPLDGPSSTTAVGLNRVLSLCG